MKINSALLQLAGNYIKNCILSSFSKVGEPRLKWDEEKNGVSIIFYIYGAATCSI